MSLPLFYSADIAVAGSYISLEEETSRHIVQVLRMKAGELIELTDGAGKSATCVITDAHKKHAGVQVQSEKTTDRPSPEITIAVSPIKNRSRFEWFVEKAAELGVTSIIPLICERTEKEKFRIDRLEAICISAMLQSGQSWLTRISGPLSFHSILNQKAADNFIAHCGPGEKKPLKDAIKVINKDAIDNSASRMILVGPEGDFTPNEISLAIAAAFNPVSLGDTRLRTETAALAASLLLKLL